MKINFSLTKNVVIKNILFVCFLCLFVWSLDWIYHLVRFKELENVGWNMSIFFNMYPPVFLLIIPLTVVSIYLLISAFLIRKMTRYSWIFSIITLILVFLSNYSYKLVIEKLLNLLAGNQDLPSEKNLIVWIGAVAFIMAVFLLIVFRRRFKEVHNRNNKLVIIFISIYSVLALAWTVGFVSYVWVGAQEKPFIGYALSQDSLGKKPVYFNYLPNNLKQIGIFYNNDDEGFTILYGLPKEKDYMKALIITERSEVSSLSNYDKSNYNNIDYYQYNNVNKGTLILFEKNGVWVRFLATDDSVFTKDELLKMMESAY